MQDVLVHEAPRPTAYGRRQAPLAASSGGEPAPAGPAPGRTPRAAFSHPRAALAALALGAFAIGTTEFVAMGLLPQMADGVGVSVPSGGHLISAYALGVVVGAPILAALGARLPRRSLLMALMVAFAAGNVLCAVAPTFESLLAARFVTGLPHGAYFGVAALVAADLAGPERRARAVARVMLGLTVSNVVGVPAATWLGQAFGWRAAMLAAAVLAVLTVVCVRRAIAWTAPDRSATPRRELGALRRPQVLLAVATGSIGGGGMFAVYSYITPILTERSGLALHMVPVVLSVWGLGMVVGGLAGGRLMDWRPRTTILASFVVLAVLFAAFSVTSTHPIAAVATVFLLGFGVLIPSGLQMRLMDVAGDAQTVASSLNASAFNLANAIGAALGGLVLAAGLGLTATMWVAVALTVAGMCIYAVSLVLEHCPTPAAAAA